MATTATSRMSRPLTSSEADMLSQRQIKKHDVAIILLHWFNAIVWLLELMTGTAMLTSSLRVMPMWYVRMVHDLFGSKSNMLDFHIAVGITWIVVFAAYGIFGFRTYLKKEALQRETSLDSDDLQWLKIRALGIVNLSKEPLPPQGIYNAGQKLFAILVYLMVPMIMITGAVMVLHLGGAAVVGWAAAIHFGAVGAVLAGLMVHVYMGAIFPEEKPAFFSMLTGTVNELYAYQHHFKWWKEASPSCVRMLENSNAEESAGKPQSAEKQDR